MAWRIAGDLQQAAIRQCFRLIDVGPKTRVSRRRRRHQYLQFQSYALVLYNDLPFIGARIHLARAPLDSSVVLGIRLPYCSAFRYHGADI